jgi:hypothetical protein
MKVVVAVAVSVALFLGLAVAAGQVRPDLAQAEGTRLRAPADGEARPELLDDGSPVFVVGHRDGSVSVLSALNPHLDRLVVWCDRSRTFTEVGPATYFDEYGRYMGGPAPQGLTPFAVELVDGGEGEPAVEVGERWPAPGREVPPVQPTSLRCDVRDEPHGEVYYDAVGHDLNALYGPLQAPEDVSTFDGRFLRLDARVAVGGDQVVVCSPRDEGGCPDGARRLTSFFHDLPYTLVDPDRCVGHVDAELLARPTRSGYSDAALYPHFTEVGVAGRGGYDQQLDCEPFDEGRSVAEVAGELVAVEQSDDGEWVAVLAEPAAPALGSGIGRPEDFDDDARDRFPFSRHAIIDLGIDTTFGPPPAGERLPQTRFTPEQLRAQLEELGPLPIRLDLRPDGVIVSGYADPWDR